MVDAHNGIIEITIDNLKSSILEHKLLVIDFWASWCGPCMMLGPVIEELASEYSGDVTFSKCNTDENQEIAYQFGITAIPCLFFFKNGEQVGKIEGAYPKELLKGQIDEIFELG